LSRIETIGRATLYLGDCRDVLPGIQADCLFSSPPYNCGMNYGAANDSLSMGDFKQMLANTLVAAEARVKVVNVGQYIGSRESRVLFREVLTEVFGGQPVDEVVWNKGPANGAAWGNYPNSPRIRAQHESIYVFGNTTMPNGNGLDWPSWSRLTTSVWNIPATVDLSIHPAMMPTAVAERCIALWADVEGVVLDPFMGSGTTGIAAQRQGRNFIGIEVDPAAFDIACRRIEEAQRQGDLFIEGASS